MTKIVGIDGMTGQELARELENGGKFVHYQYCISILVMTFLQSTDIYFVRGGESSIVRGLPYTGMTLAFGWWGIPWGPIYTIWALSTNLGGGKDVTKEVLANLQ